MLREVTVGTPGRGGKISVALQMDNGRGGACAKNEVQTGDYPLTGRTGGKIRGKGWYKQGRQARPRGWETNARR